MSAPLYRARKRVAAELAKGLDGEWDEALALALSIMDEEMLNDTERQFFRPLISAEPPAELDNEC